jgi:hypothetical protein
LDNAQSFSRRQFFQPFATRFNINFEASQALDGKTAEFSSDSIACLKSKYKWSCILAKGSIRKRIITILIFRDYIALLI